MSYVSNSSESRSKTDPARKRRALAKRQRGLLDVGEQQRRIAARERDDLLATGDRVAEAESTRYGPLIIVEFTTGLRRGGLAGLQWDDLDLAKATAMISRAVVKLPGQPAVVKDTKTHLVAKVALSSSAVEALRRHRIAQAKDRLAAGALFDDRGYVFCGSRGDISSPGSLSHAVRRIATRANTSIRGVHAMRRSTASWMLHEGLDIRTVQAVLRHSAASTTLNTYAHEVEDAQAAAVARVDHYLVSTDGNRMATAATKEPEKRSRIKR